MKKKGLMLLVLLSSSLGFGQIISEFMASNSTNFPTAGGQYEDWIEIRNTSGATLDLGGWYLTDDPANLRKWEFPSIAKTKLDPYAYLIVFADDSGVSVISNELHASFKLSAGGEYLALVNSDNEVIHQYNPEFPPQTTDVSYGLDGVSGEPTYFAVPTPGAANGQGIADAVQFSANSGTFTNAFSLTLSVNSTNASIRYTTNGSLPATNSTLYTAPISVTGTTRIRAQAFDPGRTAGPVRSETFIHLTTDAAAFTSDLPLVILENFGAGEIPASTNPPPNQQLSQVMFMEPVNGVCRLSETPSVASRAGIRRRGESTLRPTVSKPNLSLETWGEINGESRSIKPLGLPAESDWILYAPWTLDVAMIRNPFIYEASNEAGRYAARTRFVEVFLNYNGGSLSAADYYGVYVLMEKIKIGPDRVDLEELSPADNTEPNVSGGYLWKLDKLDDPADEFVAADKTFQYVSPSGSELTAPQKNWLTGYINSADAAMPNGNYEDYIDVSAFADHQIFNMFAKNQDGLNFSTFLFKDRNGRINLGPIWDFDRSMAHMDKTANPAYWGMDTDNDTFFERFWIGDLRNDADFWPGWTDRWQTLRDGPLSDARMVERIERFRTELLNASARNYERWLKTNTPAIWAAKVDAVKTYVVDRAHWIDDQLVDPPSFSQNGGLIASGTQITLSCGTNKIYYTRTGADPRASGGSPSGTLYSSPITITSNTLIKTRGWNSQTFTQAPYTWPWSPLREAVFVVNPATLAITEIMYHPRSPTNTAELAYSTSDFEFIEVQNTNATPCPLTGIQFFDGISFSFAPNTTLSGGQYGVIVANLAAFKLRYPDWAERNILGVFTGKLNNDSERLKLGYAPTNMAPLLSFDYEADWYPC
ncbi:MAG: CotH kinase family protein, partial [Pontiellaceae bacterium]|nr:CotH kinase family protein [Pontiellaceae bacterium]